MKTLLRIDASSRIIGSHSGALADLVESNWKLANPEGKVIYRNLSKFQIPHIENSTIEGFFTPVENRSELLKKSLVLSDTLISELKNATEVLISSPLYNFNIPSCLKAYIDQVSRIGHTFIINNDGSFQGLLGNKPAHLALVKGGNYRGTPHESLDFQGPYLKVILAHMGINVANIFSLEGTTSDKKILKENLERIQISIQAAFN